MKIIKIVVLSIVVLIVIVGCFLGGFIYKAKKGINFYSTAPVSLPVFTGDKTILIFSKTNGFRHGAAIEESLLLYKSLAIENGWTLFLTDNAGVFNKLQLDKFKVVIWNNTSGKVLTDEQRIEFKNWIEGGGGFVGIHAAGDDSHQWDWYAQEVLQANFSHHNIGAHLDTARLYLEVDSTNSVITEGLRDTFELADEWYCFYENPRDHSSTIVYTVDESTYDVNGNIGFPLIDNLLHADKNWGMGSDHPIVWYHQQKAGRVFYVAPGHSQETFRNKNYQKVLRNAINWVGDF
jgi:uncharacterized protein